MKDTGKSGVWLYRIGYELNLVIFKKSTQYPRIIGLKNHARVNLKIEEPEGGRKPPATEKPAEAPKEEKNTDSLDDLKL